MKKIWLCVFWCCYYPAKGNPTLSLDTLLSTASPWAMSLSSCLQTEFQRQLENFHALSTGGKKCGYKGSRFHRIPGFTCQDDDFTNHNDTGSKSICGEKFGDESYILKYTCRSWHLFHSKC